MNEQDDQTADEQVDDRPWIDRSVNIMVGPGGISFVIVTALICFTVWFVLLGMGRVDLTQYQAPSATPTQAVAPAHSCDKIRKC